MQYRRIDIPSLHTAVAYNKHTTNLIRLIVNKKHHHYTFHYRTIKHTVIKHFNNVQLNKPPLEIAEPYNNTHHHYKLQYRTRKT